MDTIDSLHARVAELERQVDAMRPVVEAAVCIQEGHIPTHELYIAVRAYRAQQKEADHA